MNTEAKYGNRILYVEAPADGEGKIPVSVTYRVLRREARGDEEDREANEGLIRLFLGADSRVPVGGKALRLLEGKPLPTDQLKLARMLYDTVNEHMVYSKKGTGWGQGDAEWALRQRLRQLYGFSQSVYRSGSGAGNSGPFRDRLSAARRTRRGRGARLSLLGLVQAERTWLDSRGYFRGE
jgi:hypothetical protein